MPRICTALLTLVALLPVTAGAASLERLVMPGPVVEGHAELEDDCSSCHSSFDATKQDTLCLDCHDDVAEDLKEARGFHGRITPLGTCKRCHTEHQGRDADIVGLNEELFDHTLTDFALEGAHGAASCSGCHEAGEPHRSAPTSCIACHEDDDSHERRLGDDCGGCHASDSWRIDHFDHTMTDFPLRGRHENVACRSCHVEQTFAAPDECVSCHRKDDVHDGRRGEECGSCHSESGWRDASFDHRELTGFALAGAHGDLPCAACHLHDMEVPTPPNSCQGCHSANDPHGGRNGAECDQCHSQQRWDDARFDHAEASGFELVGAHASARCESCHRGPLTDPLERACTACHADDDPHAGVYSDCQSCHTPAGWWQVAFNHDFTSFPLIGHHKLVACESCHVDQTFQGTAETCIECHADSDRHDGTFSPHCQRCHNPNGWARWSFDHDLRTSFVLDGRHTDLACDACHKSNVWETRALSRCASCHAADDAHEGRFGPDCAECHTTESFRDTLPFTR